MSPVQSLDPAQATGSEDGLLVSHLFEGLATLGPEGRPVQGVAERYERSPDHRHFRFHLRNDAYWSNGEPVVAGDFVAAWGRALRADLEFPAASGLYFLKNAELLHAGRLFVANIDVDALKRPDYASPRAGVVPARSVVRALAFSPTHLQSSAGLPAGSYDIEAALEPVPCNGFSSHRFRVVGREGPKTKAIVSGCDLEPSSQRAHAEPHQFMLVAPHDAAPSFDPARRQDAARTPKPVGFVRTDRVEPSPPVLGVRAIDERTLEIETEAPAPFLLDLLATSVASPARPAPESVSLTNGPYVLKTSTGAQVHLTQNPKHRYRGRLAVREIVWFVENDDEARWKQYIDGEIDLLDGGIPPSRLQEAGARSDHRAYDVLGTYFMLLNVERPPLDDVHVRRALSLSVDREAVIRDVTRGRQQPAAHLVPDITSGGYDELVRALRSDGRDPFAPPSAGFDPDGARKELALAGHPVEEHAGKRRAKGLPTITLSVNRNEGHQAIASALRAMWRDHAGIEVTLDVVDWEDLTKKVAHRTHQIARWGWIGDYNHPHTFLDLFRSDSANNQTGWKSARYDELVSLASSTDDLSKAAALYREAELVLTEAAPLVPIYFYSRTAVVRPYVKGYRTNGVATNLIHWLRLDPTGKASDEPALDAPAFAPPGRYVPTP
ncbi:MAG: peptide ABC transporter substrate-binding protein [Polyangiaceae bacterium]|nr:peptide ABC transporter substrate-binding protein [Polyangiaceae bacterium]